MDESTILDLYRHDVENPRPGHYVHFTLGDRRSFSTEEFFSQTAAIAETLTNMGVGRGDRVMLLSENRPEWHMVDLATLNLGAVTVPVYATLTANQIAYQARDSGAVAAVADSTEQMAKLLEIQGKCPDLLHLIQIEGTIPVGVTSLGAVVKTGSSNGTRERFWERAEKIDEHDLATIIYTSGTTGEPKGVMLTHNNLVQNVLASAHRAPVTRDDLALEFLPLCHILERMVGYIYMWRSTSRAYCSVYDVGELMAEIRPTLFVGVPRVFEKVQQKIMDKVATAPPLKRSLFNWALGVGYEASRERLAGRNLKGMLASRFKAADRMVLSKVRQGMGGRVRYCLSGGAELPLHVNQFFHALGIELIEGYGLTETSPVIAVNGTEPGMQRLGSVGQPLENLEIKIASDGELLVRGPSVMQGYWNKPDITKEVFDEDGFFLTGDIAELDDDGFLLIIDRKKDIIVTAGGKNVAPQPIENQLKQSPLVDSAVLVGDGRPFIVALISPNVEELERWAAEQGLIASCLEELVEMREVRQEIGGAVTSVNAGLARFEQIKKFRVLPVVLSIEDGHLTPTLKVKRRVVEQQFEQTLQGLFARPSI